MKEIYKIIDLQGNEFLNNIDSDLFDFIQECDRMKRLHKNQKFTQAERLRDELAERLDDIMRIA